MHEVPIQKGDKAKTQTPSVERSRSSAPCGTQSNRGYRVSPLRYRNRNDPAHVRRTFAKWYEKLAVNFLTALSRSYSGQRLRGPNPKMGTSKARLNILFVTRKWPPAVGGMELYSREIVAAMAQLADVDVIALAGRPDGSPPSGIMLTGFLLRAAIQLAKRASYYDVVQFGDFVLFPLAVWTSIVAPRTRRLVTVHGLDLTFGRLPGWKSSIYRVYLSIACRLQGAVHCFVANSSATASVAAEIGLKEVKPIPLGVTIEKEITPTTSKLDWQGNSESGRYVLFVGRIVPRKGLAWFAENVLTRLPGDVSLKIVGTLWDEDELDRALHNSRSEYMGRVDNDELLRLRHGAAVTIMPNRRLNEGDMEGFGIAALEAAANGSILVASKVEGIVDAVVDSKTGFLLPEGDAEQWALKICELLAWSCDERVAFIEGARQVLVERYSWDRVARETLRLAG